MNDKEFYPTPSWATKAFMEKEKFTGRVLEPACGTGHISEVVKNYNEVDSQDLFEYGYGKSGIDFLTYSENCDNIITNPPYKLAEAFVHKGLEIARYKVALLLRLAFLEGQKRYTSLYEVVPPSKIYVHSKRVTMYPEGKQTGGSGTIAYAWFVWDKSYTGPTTIDWIAP